jgi:4-hydroxy-3-methylbut-2-en-1-yl diphosphate reductase
MRLVLANPRGFCAGVDRAIAVVEDLLERSTEPVFVRHEIVHNRVVVDGLRARGAVFVETLDEIPDGAVAVISAHGAPPEVFREGARRGLRLIDATCPLVSKVHLEVMRHARHGRAVVVIGHRAHVEVRGIVGYYQWPDGGGIHVVENAEEARNLTVPIPDRIGYVTQTTLALDETRRVIEVLKTRFPHLVAPHSQDICYATQNRQDAVRHLAKTCELILVIGAPHSSNSLRLCEVAQDAGVPDRLVQYPADIDAEWLAGRSVVGLTSSASAPEHLIAEAIARIKSFYPNLEVEEFGEAEQVKFRLPPELHVVEKSAGIIPFPGASSYDETSTWA